MKVLVTGGCGFLGSHVCEYFLKNQWEVVSYDNMTKYELQRTGYGTEATRDHNWNYLKNLGVKMVRADIRNFEELLEASHGCNYLVHTAAQPAMTISWEDPRLDFTTNALGTFNVLEAARAHKIPVVNTSSIHVYGNALNETLTEGHTSYNRLPAAISETEKTMVGQISPLHASKMSAEHYVRSYRDMYGMKAATFRFTGIYGERQFGGEDHGWLANFVIRAVLKRPIRIFGTGKQTRDMIYAGDGAQAFFSYFEKPIADTFNIGGGVESKISLLESIAMIEQVLGRKAEVQFEAERVGDMRYFVCDIRKAKEFGFNPKTRPHEGIRRLVDWVEKNRTILEGK